MRFDIFRAEPDKHLVAYTSWDDADSMVTAELPSDVASVYAVDVHSKPASQLPATALLLSQKGFRLHCGPFVSQVGGGLELQVFSLRHGPTNIASPEPGSGTFVPLTGLLL